MQLRVAHADLSRGISTVARAVPARTPMPILTGILVRADGGLLTLAATDLELGIECRVAAEVDSPGSAVLPARYLTEIVRRIPGGTLAWDVEAERPVARVSWQRSQFTIQGFSADQYPPLPVFPDEAPAVARDALAEALRRTVFAASQDAARPALTGVELFMAGSEFRALATDGTRVAYHRNPPAREDWSGARRVLVPARGLQELVRLLEGEGEGRMALMDNHLLLDLGDTRVALRLLDGRYPAVLEMLPREYPTVVRVDRRGLYEACERVSVVADTPERLYAVVLQADDGRLGLAANSPDVGEAVEEIPAQVEGPAMEVGFNARLLLEGLRHVEGDEVLLELSGPGSAARLRRPGDEGYLYIQMPIRLS
jgi:DNA polymerase-3 subunit beta